MSSLKRADVPSQLELNAMFDSNSALTVETQLGEIELLA
jgi:hypothetical protein